jgi:hypothetical protein
LLQPHHVHQQHRQLQHERRGLLSNQCDRQRLGMFQLRRSNLDGRRPGYNLRSAAVDPDSGWLLLLLHHGWHVSVGEFVRVVDSQSMTCSECVCSTEFCTPVLMSSERHEPVLARRAYMAAATAARKAALEVFFVHR